MPKRKDIHKIMVIGSGPIIIGQAAEFDYSGTQACLALREEGYEVVLVNSNPATIMTDTTIADKVYIEPLTVESISRIIRQEYPDAILPTLGGQVGLNMALALAKTGILDELHIELLGTKLDSIEQAEDREKFKELCKKLGEPVPPSKTVNTVEDALAFGDEIGYPIIVRPAFKLAGGTTYYAQVTAREGADSVASSIMSFTTRDVALTAPLLVTPAADSLTLYSNSRIAVEPQAGAQSLRIEMSTSTSFPPRSSYKATIAGSFESIPLGQINGVGKPADGKRYYVRGCRGCSVQSAGRPQSI